MQQYSALDYPTWDADEADFVARSDERKRLSQQLTTLLGDDWTVRYYIDFYNACQREIYTS